MQESNGSGAAPSENVGDEHREHTKSDADYKRDQRYLKEKKKAVEENVLLKERLEIFEHDKLESEGKKDELISSLRKQVAERDDRYKKDLGNLAYSTLESQVKSVAIEMGCVDNSALARLVDLQTLEVNQETFRADSSDIKLMLEDARQNMPYLFSKAGPKIDNHNLKDPNLKGDKPDLSDMTTKQKIAYAEKHGL